MMVINNTELAASTKHLKLLYKHFLIKPHSAVYRQLNVIIPIAHTSRLEH